MEAQSGARIKRQARVYFSTPNRILRRVFLVEAEKHPQGFPSYEIKGGEINTIYFWQPTTNPTLQEQVSQSNHVCNIWVSNEQIDNHRVIYLGGFVEGIVDAEKEAEIPERVYKIARREAEQFTNDLFIKAKKLPYVLFDLTSRAPKGELERTLELAEGIDAIQKPEDHTSPRAADIED